MAIGRLPIGRGAIGRRITTAATPGGSLFGALALDEGGLAGSLRVPSRITTPEPLKNNAGTVWANETDVTVFVYALTGEPVVTKTGQSTNGTGFMTVFDDALVAGTTYRVIIVLASGEEGMDKLQAA